MKTKLRYVLTFTFVRLRLHAIHAYILQTLEAEAVAQVHVFTVMRGCGSLKHTSYF